VVPDPGGAQLARLPTVTEQHPELQPSTSKVIANPAAPGGRQQGGDMLRLSHILTTAALVAVCAAPASADTGWRSSYQPTPPSKASDQDGYVLNRDYGSPDALDAARRSADRGAYVLNRDYGSPDALDAARRSADRGAYVLNRDYGSPDALDAARNLPPVQTTVLEPRHVSSGGFDWGDAGIGAAGMLAVFSIAGGSALLLTGRRRRHGIA
jgi:hypothetical protein